MKALVSTLRNPDVIALIIWNIVGIYTLWTCI